VLIPNSSNQLLEANRIVCISKDGLNSCSPSHLSKGTSMSVIGKTFSHLRVIFCSKYSKRYPIAIFHEGDYDFEVQETIRALTSAKVEFFEIYLGNISSDAIGSKTEMSPLGFEAYKAMCVFYSGEVSSCPTPHPHNRPRPPPNTPTTPQLHNSTTSHTNPLPPNKIVFLASRIDEI